MVCYSNGRMSTEASTATSTSVASSTQCPKCGLSKKSGKRSCCSRGGAWFNKCGDAGDSRFEHTWVEGIQACQSKSSAGVRLTTCMHCGGYWSPTVLRSPTSYPPHARHVAHAYTAANKATKTAGSSSPARPPLTFTSTAGRCALCTCCMVASVRVRTCVIQTAPCPPKRPR